MVVHFAGSPNLGFFTSWGAGSGALGGLSPSPLGEGLGSSSSDLNREVPITSSPLMVINGAMHCCSSLTALHRTPCLASDVSVQICRALARVNVFSWWMTQKFCGSEADGRKSCGQSPCRAGGASYQPEASCCTSGSLKAATCHKA